MGELPADVEDMASFADLAWRKLIAGQGRCSALLRELASVPGCQPQDFLRTLAIFFGALNDGRRSPLSVAPVGCSLPTHDERHILALLAASQQKDADLVEAHRTWLAQPSHQQAVSIAGRILGLMLAKAGILLCRHKPVRAVKIGASVVA